MPHTAVSHRCPACHILVIRVCIFQWPVPTSKYPSLQRSTANEMTKFVFPPANSLHASFWGQGQGHTLGIAMATTEFTQRPKRVVNTL